jgi:hypothetical protein
VASADKSKKKTGGLRFRIDAGLSTDNGFSITAAERRVDRE